MTRIRKIITTSLILALLIIAAWTTGAGYNGLPTTEADAGETKSETSEVSPPSLSIDYIDLGVPNVNSYFKAWMDYRTITNEQSHQYKATRTWGWVDPHGFLRCSAERDLGVEDDYYFVALGSYYGTSIGTKYRITTSTGNIFYAVLGDCKADIHTNSTNQYGNNYNIIEFIVDSRTLNKDVKSMGSANVYMPLNGSIAKIERMDFVWR